MFWMNQKRVWKLETTNENNEQTETQIILQRTGEAISIYYQDSDKDQPTPIIQNAEFDASIPINSYPFQFKGLEVEIIARQANPFVFTSSYHLLAEDVDVVSGKTRQDLHVDEKKFKKEIFTYNVFGPVIGLLFGLFCGLIAVVAVFVFLIPFVIVAIVVTKRHMYREYTVNKTLKVPNQGTTTSTTNSPQQEV